MRIISIILTGLIGLMLTFSVQANPKRIGYIVNYGTHEWYQNVIFGLQSRADELGIELEVMDANLDINKQTQQAEDFMTKGVDVLIMTPVNEANGIHKSNMIKIEEDQFIEEFLPQIVCTNSNCEVVDKQGNTKGYISNKELQSSLLKS